jgi:hypothetical protein
MSASGMPSPISKPGHPASNAAFKSRTAFNFASFGQRAGKRISTSTVEVTFGRSADRNLYKAWREDNSHVSSLNSLHFSNTI